MAFANISYALTFEQAHVFGEAISDEGSKCGLSRDASVSAVETALRQNRIAINEKAKYNFYLNTNSLYLDQGCVANTHLEVGFYSYVNPPNGDKAVFAEVILCTRGMIMSGPSYNLQTRINDNYRSMAEQCVSEIQKK